MKQVFIVIVVAAILFGGYVLFNNRSFGLKSNLPTGSISSRPNETPVKSKLDLSSKQLSKVPEYVFTQTSLEELDISNNKLVGSIQAEIRHLQGLKVLNASNNLMTGVPAEIGQLQYLEVLDLSNNLLTGLPNELGNLKNLRTFNISGNNYSTHDLNVIIERLPSNVKIIK